MSDHSPSPAECLSVNLEDPAELQAACAALIDGTWLAWVQQNGTLLIGAAVLAALATIYIVMQTQGDRRARLKALNLPDREGEQG